MKTIKELLDLSKQSAIVTGGAKGIGRSIVYRLCEAGAKVLVADTDEAAANQIVKELTEKGHAAAAAKIDVSNEDDIKKMIAICQQKFGSINILVNNAGIYPADPIAKMTSKEFEHVMRVNLESVFLATKYASEVMKKQVGGGSIINITSIDALHPSMVGLAHYDASKHAVWGFTKNSALELAQHNIWVNAIAPGGILTPGVESSQSSGQPADAINAFLAKIPMHRMGDPDEIGKAVLFLASDLSSYMTGSQIVVDGGALLT